MENLTQSVEYYYSGKKVDDPLELDRLQIFMKQLDKMYSI